MIWTEKGLTICSPGPRVVKLDIEGVLVGSWLADNGQVTQNFANAAEFYTMAAAIQALAAHPCHEAPWLLGVTITYKAWCHPNPCE